MADFEKAIETVLAKEGGYVNDPADAGGETNFGISKRRYPEVDIKSLTREQAIALYRRDFWNPAYDKIESQPVATKILELTLHLRHGDQRPYYETDMVGVRLVQQALRALGDREIAIDGRYGPQTLQSVRLESPGALLAAIRVQQCRHYLAIVDAAPAQKQFFVGWIRRAVAALAALVLLGALGGAPVVAQQDTLERMEEDFFKLSEPCDAVQAEERTEAGMDYRLRVYRCGYRLWRLWQYRCPEGYWSRVFLLDQADQYEDSYYLDRFAGLHNGKPGLFVEAYRPPCGA